MDRKRLKFTPAAQIKPKNFITSSVAVGSNIKPFTPTYERDGSKVCMHHLLSNEYMRMWFKELKDYERVTYAKTNTCAADSQIFRRFVQRYFTKRPLLDPKRQFPMIQNYKEYLVTKSTLQKEKNDERKHI